jgi:DNA-binding FadR family transcriptional regulator
VTRPPALRAPSPVDSAEVAFRPIRSGNAFEECVERVLSAIKLGLVASGERLPAERDLAARLGVSRVTLRDALRSLADAGWLDVRRGRHGGTFVLERSRATPGRPTRRRPALSIESLEDTLALRRVLELGAVELAASRPLGKAAEAALLAALEDTGSARLDRYRIADSRLHLAVIELTGAPSLVAAAADVRMRVNDLLDGIPLLQRNIAHSEEQHARIVRAIRRGQPNAARSAMSEHLEGTTALLRGFLS